MSQCQKCDDTGWYAYDHNHYKVCNYCCKHEKGWWDLPENHYGYEKDNDNGCCLAGCGTLRRDIKALEETLK